MGPKTVENRWGRGVWAGRPLKLRKDVYLNPPPSFIFQGVGVGVSVVIQRFWFAPFTFRRLSYRILTMPNLN